MSEFSRVIKPKDWFPKYRHMLIDLDGNFDVRDPFKHIQRIDPHARSAEIRISASFDTFGRINATKYLREVIQCVNINIEWLAIEMNDKLATDYLDECTNLLKNVSGLAIKLFRGSHNLKAYELNRNCLQLKTLSLCNCFAFIANIENWPSLKRLSISEEKVFMCEQEIANFIENNKQLESVKIDCCELQLNRIAVAFDDGLNNLQELRIENASLSLLLDQHCHNLKKLQNISRLELHDLGFNDLEFPNLETQLIRMNSILDDFAFCLSCLETLQHLTITLKGFNHLGFNLATFIHFASLKSLAISAYELDQGGILAFLRCSRSLTTLHLHTYDGKLSNALIREIAEKRANSVLKDHKLNLFVGGKHDDFTEVIAIFISSFVSV